MLKSIILSALILTSLTTYAQVSKSDLKQLQKEASLKIITIDIGGVNSKAAAVQLKTNIELVNGVRDCEVDYQNNLCRIIAGFGVEKSTILGITGRAGFKTSNYSEEIRWRTNQNANKKTQNTDEKSIAKEVYLNQEAEERINQTESKKKIETERLAALKKQQETKPETPTYLAGDYPTYEKTDSKEGDDEAYRIAKKEWIKNNPKKYQQMLNSGTRVKEIPRLEYQKMSEEKQNHIRSNPSLYKVIE